MSELMPRIHAFYSRWHGLEDALGPKGGSVLDFDLAPRGPWRQLAPYRDRLEALQVLELLQEAVAGAALNNPEAARAKLKGAEIYLRLLLGERMPFEATFAAMMGEAPAYVPPRALKEDRDRVEATLEALGFDLSDGGYRAFDHAEHRETMLTFEGDLRREAALWLDRIKDRVGVGAGSAEGSADGADIRDFSLVVVEKDAYWSNWIDGDWERGVRLQVNVHPRIRYTQTSHVGLAAHEIGGHALHVSTLTREADAGRLDPLFLNLTVHSMEAFHMEGLAQGICGLIGRGDEVSPAVRLREELSRFHMGILNNAHLDLEAGEHPARVLDRALKASPFLRRRSVIASLQDRRGNPLLRAYQFVYGPARRLFEEARALPDGARYAFLGEMYRAILTPAQIRARLEHWRTQAAGDGAGEDAGPAPEVRGPLTTAQRLEAAHSALGERVKALTFRLMERDGEGALETMTQLMEALGDHILAEDRLLLPAYGAAVPVPERGAGRSVFEAEHHKLLALGSALLQTLREEVAAAPLDLARALELMERLHPFKNLLHHHELREEQRLAPALDEVLTAQERQALYLSLDAEGW